MGKIPFSSRVLFYFPCMCGVCKTKNLEYVKKVLRDFLSVCERDVYRKFSGCKILGVWFRDNVFNQ